MSTANPRRTQLVEALRAPESDERTTVEGEPTYSLTGLTRRHVEALRDMLSVARPVNSAQVEVIVLTLPVLDKL